MQSVPDNQRRSKCLWILNWARLFYTDMLCLNLCDLMHKGFPTYIRRHDIGRSFESVKLPLLCKWQLTRSLQSKEMQEPTFSSMGHFSLSQWFRTSSLNAPVLPTVLCWILAIVVASFTISIIPTGGSTQFDVGWGPVPGPEEKWLCLCGVEGRELFARFMLLVVLAVRKTNKRRRKWKLCGTCFQYPPKEERDGFEKY